MRLNTLANNLGAKKNRKRVGRGIGSGKGKTCGRGVKGQKSRAGVAIKGFEGGQKPMIKRLPKRGFNCPTSKTYQIINLIDIEYLLEEGVFNPAETVTKESLVAVGLIKNTSVLTKLSSGGIEASKAFSIKLDAYSKTAIAAVEKAGGKVL